MQKEKSLSSHFSWFDPTNNDPQFIRLMSETLRLSDISFDAVVLSRPACPRLKNGACRDFLPAILSNSLSSGGIAIRAIIAALYAPAIIRAIRLLTKMPQPILVSSSLWFPYIDGVAVSLLRRLGVRFSILVHRPYPRRHSFLSSTKAYFCGLNDYIVLSRSTGAFLQTHYNIPAEKIKVLPLPNYNPVLDKSVPDHALSGFLSKLRQQGRRIVLCCSCISEGHGTKDLLRIIEEARSKNPGLFFFILGNISGVEGGRIAETLKARLSGKDNVKVQIGSYTDAELKAGLDFADIVLLPYRDIAQSAVLSVALGQGVPVVVSDVGAMAELVVENCNGRIVRDWSVNSWIDALKENFQWTREQIRENSERVHGAYPTGAFFRDWISQC